MSLITKNTHTTRLVASGVSGLPGFSFYSYTPPNTCLTCFVKHSAAMPKDVAPRQIALYSDLILPGDFRLDDTSFVVPDDVDEVIKWVDDNIGFSRSYHQYLEPTKSRYGQRMVLYLDFRTEENAMLFKLTWDN